MARNPARSPCWLKVKAARNTVDVEQLADRMIAAEEPGYTPRDLNVASSVETYVSTLPAHLQKDVRIDLIVIAVHL